MSVMKKAIEVASLCLSENVNLRPSSSELVLAMTYLESRKFEPKEEKMVSVNWSEMDFSPSKTKVVLDKDIERDHAVAEAKMWGESWREKQKQSPQKIYDGNTRYRPIAECFSFFPFSLSPGEWRLLTKKVFPSVNIHKI